ncbi:CHAT domain-containing protein [Streptomyces fimicarius]|uniref:CHAT domain-containing protein n=1 Tax=Streptomyces griseus TaxID=1911 RepID=UPI0035E03077
MESFVLHELMGALERRMAAADSDISTLFDEFAADEAHRLAAEQPEGGGTAAVLLAQFHWLRFTAAEQALGSADLRQAIRLTGTLPAELREDVPLPLRVLARVDPDASGAPEDWCLYAAEGLNTIPGPAALEELIGVLAVVDHMATGALRTPALVCFAEALLRRAVDSTDPLHLDTAISVGTRISAEVPADHPRRWLLLSNLAVVLRRRSRSVGDPGDLDAAITAGRAAAQQQPASAVTQSGIAIALHLRHRLTRAPADLSDALHHARLATDLFADGDPELAVSQVSLAWLLLARARETDSATDLGEALGLARAVSALPQEIQPPDTLDVLSEVLELRFDRSQELPHLLDLEQVLRQLLSRGAPAGTRARLALSLACRFDLTQDLVHLDEGVAIWRGLADEAGTPEGRRSCGLALADSLRMRAGVCGSAEDLVDSIMCAARALAKAPGADRPELAALEGRLLTYARTGDAGTLLDPAAARQAMDAVEPDGLGYDLAARVLAGWVLWLRGRHLGKRPGRREMARAARVLDPVYLVAPSVVPAPLEALRDAEAAAVDGAGPTDRERRHNASGILLQEQFLETGDEAALQGAIRQLREAASVGTDEENRAAGYNNLSLALSLYASWGGGRDAQAEAVDAARRSVELSHADAPYLPGRLSLLCGALASLGEETADLELIREARRAGERGVALTPADHPSRGLHLANLCTAFVAEYAHVGDTVRLRETVERFKGVLPLLPPGHRHHLKVRVDFARALNRLATATGSAEPLRGAEQILQEAMASARGLPRFVVLSELAATLHQLYHATEEQQVLADAVVVGRELVAATEREDEELLLRLRRLAEQCSMLFARTEDGPLLDEGIDLLRRAWSFTEPSDPELRGSRALVMLLRWKAEDTGDAAFLEEAENVSRQAVRLRPQHAEHLADHACVLMRLHLMTGRLGVLRSSIEAGFEALERTRPDDPDRDMRGAVLIDGLRALHELTGERDARDRGIELAREELERDAAPDSYWRFALATMYAQHAGDLGKATELLREYLEALPADHHERPWVTGGLANAFIARYMRTGALAFLQEAIQLLRGSRAQDAPALRNSLAGSLFALHQRTGDPAALVEAVDIARALARSETGPYRSLYLGNLADYLAAYARLAGDGDLLRQSLDVSRAAVVAAGGDLVIRAGNLSRLSHALRILALHDRDPRLVSEAVEAAREAVRIGARTQTVHERYVGVLGSALIDQGLMNGDRDALAEARDVFARAALFPGATLKERISLSRRWAEAAMLLDDPQEAERAYRHAVGLLAERAGPSLAWADREFGIEEEGGLPGDAAAAAIAAGHLDSAVGLLEQSRGVLLAEALHTRIDLCALEKHSPQLAEDFRRVSGELRAADLPHPPAGSDGPAPAWVAERRLELGQEWLRVCERVREAPGFEEFLLPPALSAVGDATRGGTVVIVNISVWRCDALLVTGGVVELVALPELSAADCLAHANEYLVAVQDYRSAVQSLAKARGEALRRADAAAHQAYHAVKLAVKEARSAVESALTATLAWLWDAVAEPVVEHLNLDETTLPRLWWCPTGPLSLLPLHAAGRPADRGRSLLDVAVSSYAPSLRALVNAHRSSGSDAEPKMLVVALPRTPGTMPLPNAARERDHLVSLFPPPASTVLSDDDATRDGVMEALAHHRWVHFSCHGEQVLDAPAESRLLLTDGPLTVARLIEHMPSGEFAFLSACQTASSGVTLLDEVITPASALHHAGYRHVVATLWPVLDTVAADVTEATYDALTVEERFEPAGAARALHTAVGILRARYADQPSVWASYVHIGV